MPHRELTPWREPRLSPFAADPFTSIRRDMSRLLDELWSPAEPRAFGPPAAALWPSLEIKETDQAYQLSAELAGLEQKDVQLDLRDNVLTLSGERRDARSENEDGRYYTERSYGRFERRIPFDHEVDADKVEATFKNGVLNVTLPKNPNARDQSRRIEVRTG